MVEYYSVESYKLYLRQFKLLAKKTTRILTLFCGALDATGRSWCPDCREAMPIIHSIVQSFVKPGRHISYLFIGIDRDEWQDPNNRYRMDSTLRLTNVPTLICWDDGKEIGRLVEKDCSNPEAVMAFFERIFA